MTPAVRTHKGAFIAAALACALGLMGFGCISQGAAAVGDSTRPSATASGGASSFNDADVVFARQMTPHHQQAIQMAKVAASHAQNPKVKELAANIEAAQAPEIETMTSWLHAWGKPVPTVTPGMMSPMPGMMGSPPPGMMSQQEMSRMMAVHGAQFDRVFLQMMIGHHQGAVQMARTEQARGVNPAAKQLARQIESSQTAEIAQMQEMLKH